MLVIYYARKKVIVIENSSDPKEEVDLVEYEIKDIKSLIYTIKGKQVMLDSDVAMLYHYKTKRINETVARNRNRFPDDFCFQLTENELAHLRSQFATSSVKDEKRFQNGTTLIGNKENLRLQNGTSSLEERWSQFATTYEKDKYRGKKYLPYAFTEQGIAMLSGLLRNEIAVTVSINIMRAFVEMKKFISANGQVFERLTNVEYKLLDHDKKFDQAFNELQKDEKTEFKQKVFFDGQIYDAYSLVMDIIKNAKEKLIIIDNYIDDTILEMLTKKNRNVSVIILTSERSNISKIDVEKFNKEYPKLELAKTDKFHDRFIVVDNRELYHVEASLKDLGKKCFAISRIEDNEYIEKVVKVCYQK